MSNLSFWEPTFARHLNLVLLHSLWQCALLGILAWWLTAAVCSTAQSRYRVGYAALLVMLAAPVCTWFLTDQPVTVVLSVASGEPAGKVSEADTRAAAAAAVRPPSPVAPATPDSRPKRDAADTAASLARSRESHSVDAAVPINTMPNERSAESVSGRFAEADAHPSFGSDWLALFWVAGVIVMAVRHLGGWVLARRLLADSTPLNHAPLQTRLKRLTDALKIRRRLRVFESSAAGIPMVIGFMRPAIVLPTALITGMPWQQCDAILAHELAHIRRRDEFWNLLQIVIETLLFYHPAVWWLSRRIRMERENCCDDLAIEACGDRLALAEGIASIEADRLVRHRALLALSAAGTGDTGQTLQRIQRILGVPASRRGLRGSGLAGLLILTLLVGGTWAAHRSSSDKPGQAEQSEAVDSSLQAPASAAVGSPATSPLAVPRSPANLAQAAQTTTPTAGADKSEPQQPQSKQSDFVQPNSSVGNTATQDDEQIEPWELSKRYDPGWLRHRLMNYETLPEPITVPPVRAVVLTPAGDPAAGAVIHSHTPRQWTKIHPGGILKPSPHEPYSHANAAGRFNLPQRREPYRVLVAHETGVASLTHEELINADGRIQLLKWSRIAGKFVLAGRPQPNTRIRLYMNTVPWSYSSGGPRLTLDYNTTTDANGEFVFEKVPPLGGRVHVIRDRRLSHGARFQCEPGQTAQVVIGEGRTITGRLAPDQAPDGQWPEGSTVTIRHVLPQPPAPAEVTQSPNPEAFRKWRDQWYQTTEGQAFGDRMHDLINMNYPGDVQADGRFTVYGVPKGEFRISVQTKAQAWFVARQFRVDSSEGPTLDLGVIERAEPPPDADEATGSPAGGDDRSPKGAESEDGPASSPTSAQPVKPQLPELKVLVMDKDRQPLSKVGVMLYDRNSFMAGQPQDFKMQHQVTDKDGVARFGRLPQTYFCVDVSGRDTEFDRAYAVIYRDQKEFRHTNPERPFAEISAADGELTIRFTMRRSFDLEFEVTDSQTGEAVPFPLIYYWDAKRSRWWTLSLIDGGGQHDFAPIIAELNQTRLRVAADNYFPEVFQLSEPIGPDKKVVQKLKLKPAPRIRFQVLTPDGKPAAGARCVVVNEEELYNFNIQSGKLDEQGRAEKPYPTQGALGRYVFQHETGEASVGVQDLAEPQTIERDGETVRIIDQVVRLKAAGSSSGT